MVPSYEKYTMEVRVWTYLFLLSLFYFAMDILTSAYPILVSNSSVIENGTYNMQCSTRPGARYSTWIRNENDTDSATFGYTQSNVCISETKFIIDNPQLYQYSCFSNNTVTIYSLMLKNVGRHQHSEKWQCMDQEQHRSNTVEVRVLVPVQSITFVKVDSNKTAVQENVRQHISCATSFSRPNSPVTWYITNNTGLPKVPLQESDSQYNSSDTTGLVSTISNLNISFNRTYNQWNLVCQAENIQGYDAVSKSLLLNVTYPTNQPTVRCLDNGIYKVVQNTQGKLTCSVNGGNPAGTLHWNCTGDVTEYHGPNNNNVTQTLVWTATQIQNCTCAATNIAGNRSTSLKTELLYPPVLDALQDKDEFEGDSVTLQCVVVQSNPSVSVIRWTSNRHSTPVATLLISNISRADNGTYTCTANNTMVPSCQDVVHGSASRSLHVKVLYPPTANIPQGKSFTVKEGDRFSYTCPVEPGNPPSTNTTWRRSIDTKTWSSSELLILNVTRYDDSVYTCNASNVMVNSNGIRRIGNASGDIRLVVQFKTNVTDFYIRNQRNISSVTVMENTSLVFECRLQSNPTSDVRLFEAERLVNNTRANELMYFTRATCSGGPVSYSCQGNNSLSNEPSNRNIKLIVTCTPRRNMEIDELVAAGAINDTVTLSYTALAYPFPTFTWYRNDSSIDATDPRFKVSSNSFKTNLTITQVLESDFGEYTLIVANDIGLINESFHLKPQEESISTKLANTSPNISAIVGGTLTGVFVVGIIVGLTFIYRRRFVKDEQSGNSSDQPVTYENLKIEQIPNAPLDNQRESSNNETPGTNVDACNTYEGLTREDNEKESEYTQLGNTSNDSNEDAKQTYENLKIQLSSCQPSYDVTSTM